VPHASVLAGASIQAIEEVIITGAQAAPKFRALSTIAADMTA